MGKRRLTSRQRRQRAKIIRNRVITAALVLMLAAAAMAPALREQLMQVIDRSIRAAQAFAVMREGETVVTLEPIALYALQLGVYDNGERAQSERERLSQLGIPCAIWQESEMRLIAAVSASRETMDMSAAKGQESFIVAKTLEKVELKLSAEENSLSAAAELMRLPDETLIRLMDGRDALSDILADVREKAERAVGEHPENELYTQLAQSMLNWCALIERTSDNSYAYAGATMALLCTELRRTLLMTA